MRASVSSHFPLTFRSSKLVIESHFEYSFDTLRRLDAHFVVSDIQRLCAWRGFIKTDWRHLISVSSTSHTQFPKKKIRFLFSSSSSFYYYALLCFTLDNIESAVYWFWVCHINDESKIDWMREDEREKNPTAIDVTVDWMTIVSCSNFLLLRLFLFFGGAEEKLTRARALVYQ